MSRNHVIFYSKAAETNNQESEDGSTPDFPSELITEILLRLPVKSLCRLKCASKPWQSLISKSSFTKRHLIFRKENGKEKADWLFSISGNHNCYSVDLESLDSKPTRMTFPNGKRLAVFKVIWNSCDGIILISYYFTLFLVNPSTHECRELPAFPTNIHSIASPIYYGFGYDASIDDYKVVRISQEFESKKPEVCVYNLRTNSWRRIASSQTLLSSHKLLKRCVSGAFVNGVLHWVRETEILSFNLAKESFRSMSFPYSADEIVKLGSLYVLGDCLCGLGHEVEFDYAFDVWVMKKDSWVRLRVNHHHTLISWVLPTVSDKNFMCQGKKIIEYDPETDQAKQLTRRVVGGSDIDRTIYQESLIRLQDF